MSEPNQPTSPLAEAKPDSLAEIFNRDPLELSRQDRDRIVAEERRARALFAIEDAKPKAKKGEKLRTIEGPVSLGDLGL